MIKRFAAFLATVVAALSLSLAVSTTASAKTNEVYGFMEWDAEAAAAAIAAGDRVVINVWATWCPNCTSQRRAFAMLLQSDPEAYADVKVFAIDIDDADRPSMVGPHKARKTTMIFYNDGEEIGVYTGKKSRDMAAFLNVSL